MPHKTLQSVPFRGAAYSLSYAPGETEIRVENDSLILPLPPTAGFEDLKVALRLFYRKEARRRLPERTRLWQEKLGVAAPRLVKLTQAQSRWGSCTSDNEIRLNWRLILTPDALQDYVVAHELCHIPHKNHGPHFWAALAAAMPDCKARRQELRLWEKKLATLGPLLDRAA